MAELMNQVENIDCSIDHILGNPEIPLIDVELTVNENWEPSEDKKEFVKLTEIFK